MDSSPAATQAASDQNADDNDPCAHPLLHRAVAWFPLSTLSPVAFSTQLRQIQARPFKFAGTAARISAGKATPWHQHGAQESPDAATAHSFAEPHRGQVRLCKGPGRSGSVIETSRSQVGQTTIDQKQNSPRQNRALGKNSAILLFLTRCLAPRSWSDPHPVHSSSR